MYEAARLYDPIEHTQAAMGFILGAIVGAVFIAVASAALVIFGCGFFLGLFMGFLIGKIGLGILEVGEAEGRKHTVVTGKITEGSHNVFTNSRKAAIVERSTATCEKHPPVTRVAEGSTNIFINSKAAARKGDRTQCDAKISDGSDNVFLGGGAKAYLPITPEVPDSWRISTGWLFMAAGFLGGTRCGFKQDEYLNLALRPEVFGGLFCRFCCHECGHQLCGRAIRFSGRRHRWSQGIAAGR
ncbi:PAAR domain-containing protein [Escherichia marmotae]|nr:PAAR domain-containing protein [Escherichia marmotae]